MTAAALRPVRAALDRAADRGARVSFWWRDDDAVRHTPALDRLLGLAASAGVPLALAAVPAGIERSLFDRLGDEREVAVLVHGLSHANHAGPGEKPAEFGPHRPLAHLLDDAKRGRALAREAANGVRPGPRLLDVFVPPWNRIAPDLAAGLAGAGFVGLSGFGRYGPATGPVRRIDTHLDPVDWRGTRGLADPAERAARLAAAIDAARPGDGPLGLLTHHLVADEPVWRFCADVLAVTAPHGAADWPDPVRHLWPDRAMNPAGAADLIPCTA